MTSIILFCVLLAFVLAMAWLWSVNAREAAELEARMKLEEEERERRYSEFRARQAAKHAPASSKVETTTTVRKETVAPRTTYVDDSSSMADAMLMNQLIVNSLQPVPVYVDSAPTYVYSEVPMQPEPEPVSAPTPSYSSSSYSTNDSFSSSSSWSSSDSSSSYSSSDSGSSFSSSD